MVEHQPKPWWQRILSRGNILTLPIDLCSAAIRRFIRAWSHFRLATLYGACIGRGCHIGPGLSFVHPQKIAIRDSVVVGRHVRFWSEHPDGTVEIGNRAEVGRDSLIDFSGGLTIGPGVLISEEVLIYTHDHGHDPRSTPHVSPLVIHENAWIGARAIILPSVNSIGRGAIIGAGATVTRDVPDDHVFVSAAGRLLAKKSESGRPPEERTDGTSAELIREGQ